MRPSASVESINKGGIVFSEQQRAQSPADGYQKYVAATNGNQLLYSAAKKTQFTGNSG
jgi:hypothetical protein